VTFFLVGGSIIYKTVHLSSTGVKMPAYQQMSLSLKFLVNYKRKLAVLKLGVATLLRVAKCPKRPVKVQKREKKLGYWAFCAANKPKIKGLTWYFYIKRVIRFHLGREIFLTSLGVASQKSLRTSDLSSLDKAKEEKKIAV
jgi:hypothetical protein